MTTEMTTRIAEKPGFNEEFKNCGKKSTRQLIVGRRRNRNKMTSTTSLWAKNCGEVSEYDKEGGLQ